MIVVGSIWRDSAGYIDRSLAQFAALREALNRQGVECRFVFAENASTDDTFARLEAWRYPTDDLVAVADGCPYYPSVDIEARWRHIAWVCNHVMERVGECDQFIYVESDLRWDVDTMLTLLNYDVDAVSPLNVKADGRYYDTWGSRIGGVRFGHEPPFHPSLPADALVPADSIAGCTVMRGAIARQARFSPKDCYIGLCRDIRSKGYELWLDSSLQVTHP